MRACFSYRFAMVACSKEADLAARQAAMLRLLNLQRLDRVAVDSYALVLALHACAQTKDVTAARRLLLEHHAAADAVCYNAALHACAEGSDPQAAKALLIAMRGRGLKLDVTSFNCAIRACFNGGDVVGAVALFEQLRKDPALQPDEYTVNALICGFFAAGSPSGDADGSAHALRALDLARVVGSDVSVEGKGASGGAYNVALQAALKAKDWSAGEKVLQKFEQRGGCLNVHSFSILVGGAINSGDGDKLDASVRQAAAQGFGPKVFADAVKRAAKHPTQSRRAFQLLEASHFAPAAYGLSEPPREGSQAAAPLASEMAVQRVYLFECAMHACAATRASKGLVRRLHRMALAEGLVPTLSMWTLAIDACGADFARALKLLDAMVKQGAATDGPAGGSQLVQAGAPNAITYAATIGVCARAKRGDVAVKLVAEMLECGVPFNEVVFANAINACAKAGEWQAALSLLRTMDAEHAKGHGPPPNVVVFTAALGACREAKQVAAGLALLDEMRARGLEPNEVTLHVAAGMLAASGRHADAKALLEDSTSRDTGTVVGAQGDQAGAKGSRGRFKR